MARRAYPALLGVRPLESRSDRRIDNASILTVDAFDTLITRSVYFPTDVFTLSGSVLLERGLISVEPAIWGGLRHRAETAIRKAFITREVSLFEIYEKLVEHGALDREHIHEAILVERDIEQSVSRPVAATIDCVNRFAQAGRPAMVLSDTCMPSEDVWRMLCKAGLKLPRAAIHASSDTGKTKRYGSLFNHIVPPDGARGKVHVGDNLTADFRQARRAGFNAVPYLAGTPSRFERALYRSLDGSGLLGSVIAGSARATRLGRGFPTAHAQAIWDLSADMTGPLLFAFVAWILREAVQRGLRTLYFLSRDGEILLKVARELQPVFAPSVECRYLYVSRQSLHLPGLVEIGRSEHEWIMDNAELNSLDYFLRRLDITFKEFATCVSAESSLACRDPRGCLTSAEVGEIGRCLEIESFRSLILTRASSRRAICLDYLMAEGMLADGLVGLVDVGWRGRLQRSLCRMVSTIDPTFADRLHGFYIDLDVVPQDAGTLDRFSRLLPERAFSWAARGSILEILCAAHHATVKGYRRRADGTVTPVLAAACNGEAKAWGLGAQQEAVVAFALEAVSGLRLARLNPLESVDALARAALEVVKMFVERPGRAEADAFGCFGHSSDEQHNITEAVAGRIDYRPRALLKRLGPAYRSRRISYWPEGSVASSVPRWLRSSALSVFRAMPGRHG